MGYNIDLVAARFRIKAEKRKAVMEAIVDWLSEHRWLSWITKEEVEARYAESDVFGMFRACRWSVASDDSGDLVDIEFCGEKLGDDESFFRAIAPHVESKSYLQIRGEEGHAWRWYFLDGRLHDDNIKVTWDSDSVLDL
jgi:hypothetical protein